MKARRRNLTMLVPALPALAAFGIYLAMLPEAITAANFSKDGGDFLAAALTGGVPHPSGYPSYILLLRLFLGLPFGSDYFKGSLLSATAAALAVLLLCYLIAHRSRYSRQGIAGAVAGGLALAFAPLFWSQAVVVEVQALQAFLVALALWWVTLLEEPGFSTSKKIKLLLLAWGFGFGAGNHLTLLFMAPLALVAVRKASVCGLKSRWIAGQGIAFLAGCLVYLYLPAAARQYPPVNWGNPQSLAGFWWTVSGAPYHNMLFGVTAAQFLERLGTLARLLGEQFGLAGILAAVLGIMFFKSETKLFRWGLVWIFAVYSIFYLTYNSNDAMVYLISAWVAFSAWIGNGITILWGKKIRTAQWGTLACVAILAALVGRIPQGWASVDPRRDSVTRQYLETVQQQAPANALVLSVADADSFPLWYGIFGEGMRKDLRVIVLPLTQFQWYQDTLRHTYPDLVYPPAEGDAAWGEKLAQLNAGRAVCRSETVGGNLDQIKITCGGIEILNLDFSKEGN
jgi:hypothetical protein